MGKPIDFDTSDPIPEDLLVEYFPPSDRKALPALSLGVGLHADVPHEVYLRDPAEGPSLSASIAHVICAESPLHAWQAHPRFGAAGVVDKHTDATERGTVIHRLMLGRGATIVPLSYDNYKTKAARAARDEVLAEGKLPVLTHRFVGYKRVADVYTKRVRDLDPSCNVLLTSDETEITAVWKQAGVLCRCRIDHLRSRELIIDDLKTSVSVRPDYVEKIIYDHGLDIQHAANIAALEHLIPDAAGRVRMRFVFLEAEPPHDVVVYELPGDYAELGRRRWQRALDTWAPCLEADVWPGHSRHILRPAPPGWILSREMDRELGSLDVPINHPF